mgnify:CR=1 FL=1
MTSIAQHVQRAFLETPFHNRAVDHCVVNDWYTWKGYTVVNTFEDVEFEYFAIRNSASVFDLSPMSKYRIHGRDAEAFLNRLVYRDSSQLAVGRVAYAVWCNDRGKVVDDGTIFRLGKEDFRLCAQERQLDWLMLSASGFDVDIVEETRDVAALSLQGPTSAAVLKAMGLQGVEALKPFALVTLPFETGQIMVSRTGFTGDLGYELWIDPALAERLWDRVFAAGEPYNIRAIGARALEIARIEAGFIQAGVDFLPAPLTIRNDHDRSPFELDLGWLVDFKKPHFTGRRALAAEKNNGSQFRLVKLDVEGNKVARDSFIYLDRGKTQVGTVTSAVWSPITKANIAFATVEEKKVKHAGTLWAEIYFQRELRWHKKWARCTVVERPFWDPKRRRATPPADC